MNLRFSPAACISFSLAIVFITTGRTSVLGEESVYYLKVAVSVTTDTGVHSALAGTKVTKVGTAPGGLKVKLDDGNVANVTMKQLTTDPKEAEQLAQQASERKEAAAAQIQAAAAARAAEDAAASQRAADGLAQRLKQTSANSSAPTAPTTISSGLTGSALDDKGSGTATVNHPKPKTSVKGPVKKK
jgi:hypothetical protein